MRLSWPLIGRTGELKSIEAAISASGVSGVLVCGAEGVGKSRIARDALSALASRGYETRWAVGTSPGRTIPLGSFNAWAPPTASDTAQMVRGAIESLTAAAPSAAGVVLAVDDVHLLDELSTFVLHHIVQRGAAKVILTVRDDEPVPKGVQEVWRASQFDRLEIAPLSLSETTLLLSAALGGSMDADAARRLWELTRGNVLYLRNIVEQEVADCRIVHEGGYWRWIGDPVMPRGLVELVESRLGGVPQSVREVVDVLAVGEPVELDALTRITDAAAVEAAESRGLIALQPSESQIEVRLAHPLYGQVRRRCAPQSRLRRLRGLLAAELADCGGPDDIRVIVRRATLVLDSDVALDVDLLVTAAHGAIWMADLPLADRLADAAIRAGAGPELNFVRAHALSWLGRGEEAEALLADTPTGELTDHDRARHAFIRCSNMLWALAEPATAKKIIDEAASSTPPDARVYVDAFLAVYWFAMDEPDSALEASKALAMEDISVVGAEIAWVLAQVLADAGRVSEAVAAAAAGYAVAARTLDAPQMRFNIVDAELSALVMAGRVADALDVAERSRRQAAHLPGAAQLLGAAVAGRAALGAGDLDGACRLLGYAAEGLSASHPLGWGYRYRVSHVTALAMRGSTREALAALSVLNEVPRRFRTLDYERSLAQAWVAASQGAVSEAVALARSAAERAGATGRFAAEVICLQAATQFGDHSGGPRLRELEAIVEGPRVGLVARFAEAIDEDDAAELVTLSKEFEQMGDLVAAVDAAAHAALTYRRQDRRGSTLGCAARATTLAERCGGASTPTLRMASTPLPFTDREVEIVMLIGDGSSNREIAERLTLSVRTVESHIYRAMSKTGTTTRDELAALLPHQRTPTE